MAQVTCLVTVNIVPSNSGELVVDLCDDLLMLLEVQASTVGMVVDTSYKIATDDEVIVGGADGRVVDEELQAAMALSKDDLDEMWEAGEEVDDTPPVPMQEIEESDLLAEALGVSFSKESYR